MRRAGWDAMATVLAICSCVLVGCSKRFPSVQRALGTCLTYRKVRKCCTRTEFSPCDFFSLRHSLIPFKLFRTWLLLFLSMPELCVKWASLWKPIILNNLIVFDAYPLLIMITFGYRWVFGCRCNMSVSTNFHTKDQQHTLSAFFHYFRCELIVSRGCPFYFGND